MKNSCMVLAWVVLFLLGSAAWAANTTVPAGATLVLEEAGGTFQNRTSWDGDWQLLVRDGATLQVPMKSTLDNVLSGFATFTASSVQEGWPTEDTDWFDCIDYLRAINTTIFRLYNAETTSGLSPAEYCSAYWTVSEEKAGTYSFYEFFNGFVLVALDGNVILRDTNPATASQVRDVEVSAGVHTLTLAFGGASGTGEWGPKGKDTGSILFSSANADINANTQQGRMWDPSKDDLKMRLPSWTTRYTLQNRLTVNGSVALVNPAGSGFSYLRLIGGLLGGGTLTVTGAERLEFGENRGLDMDYPAFDGAIVFGGDAAAKGKVFFTNRVTFVRMPVGTQYDFSGLVSYKLTLTNDFTFAKSAFGGKDPEVVTVQEGTTLRVAESCTIKSLAGRGTLVAPDGVVVRLEYTDAALNLQTEGTGRFELADTAATIERDYSKDMLLWFDASVPESFVGYRSRKANETSLPYNYTHYTNDYPLIEKWLDRRPKRRTLCAFNARHVKYDQNQHYPELYPYVVSNGLNGLPYVSCGGYQHEVAKEWTGNLGKAGNESRRLPFTYYDESRLTGIDPIEQRARHIIMVFGSQQGGGIQIIGRTHGTGQNMGSAFRRKGTTLADPFMMNHYTMWADGASVESTNACPNGGWQVLSIDCTGGGVGVAGLGWGTNGTGNSGGQNYAEVMIFTNRLENASRVRIEKYLARKWGIEDYLDDGVRHVRIGGEGSLAVSNEIVTLSGVFNGTVDVAGGRVRLAAPVPTEEDVAQTQPKHWFDPSVRDSVLLSSDKVPASLRANSVWGIFDRRVDHRTAGNFHLYAPGIDSGHETDPFYDQADRRPKLTTRQGGGRATAWIDYDNAHEGYADTFGNTLRFGKLNNDNVIFTGNNHTASGNNQTATSIRTGFIVQDSVRGGGVPFADTIAVNGIVQKRTINNAAAAIYASGTGAPVGNGRVWLDGVAKKPKSEGFGGRPEVLTFETSADYALLNFASYGGDGGGYNGGQEIQAEILAYDSVLPNDTRALVEAYLLWKWTGRYRACYGDCSGVKFSGSGTVVVPTDRLTFTAHGAAATVAQAYDLGTCAVEASATGMFEVDIADGLAPGEYTLVRTATPSAFVGWTVAVVNGSTKLRLALMSTIDEIRLHAFARGTCILIR